MKVGVVACEAVVEAVRAAVDAFFVFDDWAAVSGVDVVIVDDEVVLRSLRARDEALPVMLVTSPGDVEERIQGLLAGADDAVPLDVAHSQMGARVVALSRRGRLAAKAPEVIDVDGCRFDLGAGVASRDDEDVSLTAKEISILRYLFRHKGRAVTRGELLESVWGASPDMLTKTVDVTIHNLRKKIERDPSRPQIIRAKKGVGYIFTEL